VKPVTQTLPSVVKNKRNYDNRHIDHRVEILKRNNFNFCLLILFFFYLKRQPRPPPPPVGQELLFHEVPISRTSTRHSRIGLVWTCDQLIAETSTLQHTTLRIDKHTNSPVGFEFSLSRRETADLRLRPRVHWEQLKVFSHCKLIIKIFFTKRRLFNRTGILCVESFLSLSLLSCGEKY
jgi:hypothetical protein